MGLEGEVDHARAAALFAEAAQANDPLAKAWHARLFLYGRADVVENRDFATSATLAVLPEIERRANEGEAEAQFLLASAFQDGLGLEPDDFEARKWYEAAAAQDHPLAVGNLAWMIVLREGGPRDGPRAYKLFRHAVDLGDRHVLRQVGVMHYYGIGTERDYLEARRWFAEATKYSDAVAWYNIGLMWESGLGGDVDAEKARDCYREAVKGKHLEGAFRLGILYYRGMLGERDLDKAVRWFMYAAHRGHATAMYNLAGMISEGWGTRADPSLALLWYRRAAEAGYVNAMRVVAETAWREGREDEAIEWSTKAAENGDAGSARQLAEYYTEAGASEAGGEATEEWLRQGARFAQIADELERRRPEDRPRKWERQDGEAGIAGQK